MTSQHACVAIEPMPVHGMIVLALKCPAWASKASSSRIAQGIQDNGFGDGGMLLGMNMAQAINPMTAAPVQAPAPAPAPEAAAPASHTASMSVEEQVEAMKKLKELVDIGILSQEEFDAKKHEILGL